MENLTSRHNIIISSLTVGGGGGGGGSVPRRDSRIDRCHQTPAQWPNQPGNYIIQVSLSDLHLHFVAYCLDVIFTDGSGSTIKSDTFTIHMLVCVQIFVIFKESLAEVKVDCIPRIDVLEVVPLLKDLLWVPGPSSNVCLPRTAVRTKFCLHL